VERSELEIRAIARKIISESRKTAHVDTGYLKRSIYYVIDERGKLEFGEVFYGQFGENSELQENIERMLPKDIPYSLIWTDEEGMPYEAVRKTASGRIVQKTVPPKIKKKNLSIGGIKNFLKGIPNGKEKVESADGGGQNNTAGA
jgi:hypothetical protein